MDLIMGALDECSDDIQHYVSLADDITDKVHKTKSVSMIKSMEHKLMNIDKTLSRCNALIFIIDESQFAIEEILQVTKENKHRILN
jgi:hypothetical protein